LRLPTSMPDCKGASSSGSPYLSDLAMSLPSSCEFSGDFIVGSPPLQWQCSAVPDSETAVRPRCRRQCCCQFGFQATHSPGMLAPWQPIGID
jgi:hypothetical protein